MTRLGSTMTRLGATMTRLGATMTRLGAIVIAGALACTASAQDLRLTGYLAVLPAWQRLGDLQAGLLGARDITTSLTRLRVRTAWDALASTRINLEYDLAFAAASRRIPFDADAGPRQGVDLTWQPVAGAHAALRHTIDRLAVQHDAGNLRIVAGRQRIAWGSGRVWNPTDLFNPINPAAWDVIEKDGADALLVRWTAGDFTDVTAVVNPARRGTGGAVRVRSSVDPVDVSLMGGSLDHRIVAGWDVAASIAGAGVRTEGIVSARSDDAGDSYVRCVAGTDYQITPTVYVLAEYQYNGEGASTSSNYDVSRLLRGEILNVGRAYLALATMVRLHDLVVASLQVASSWSDGSGYGYLRATWSTSDETTVAAGCLVPWGEASDEFRLYPTAVHAMLAVYF